MRVRVFKKFKLKKKGYVGRDLGRRVKREKRNETKPCKAKSCLLRPSFIPPFHSVCFPFFLPSPFPFRHLHVLSPPNTRPPSRPLLISQIRLQQSFLFPFLSFSFSLSLWSACAHESLRFSHVRAGTGWLQWPAEGFTASRGGFEGFERTFFSLSFSFSFPPTGDQPSIISMTLIHLFPFSILSVSRSRNPLSQHTCADVHSFHSMGFLSGVLCDACVWHDHDHCRVCYALSFLIGPRNTKQISFPYLARYELRKDVKDVSLVF